MYQILIIEGDIEINNLLAGFLSENGYNTMSQYDGRGTCYGKQGHPSGNHTGSSARRYSGNKSRVIK